MLAPMPRRVPPLAAAIVLVAAALVATVWTTRTAVLGAYTAVGEGQAYAIQGAVRADLAELPGAPSVGDLETIVREIGRASCRERV